MTLAPISVRPGRLAALVSCALVLALITAVIGYRVGRQDRQQQWVVSGTAYVGADEVGLDGSGWHYGFSAAATPWFDAQGGMHDGSTAPCLKPFSTPRIQVGAAQIDNPDGGAARVVGWVRCLGSADIDRGSPSRTPPEVLGRDRQVLFG